MKQIATWIARVLASPDDRAAQEQVRGAVRELCQHFPVPSDAG